MVEVNAGSVFVFGFGRLCVGVWEVSKDDGCNYGAGIAAVSRPGDMECVQLFDGNMFEL